MQRSCSRCCWAGVGTGLRPAHTSLSSPDTLTHTYQADDIGVMCYTSVRTVARGAVEWTGVRVIFQGTL